MIKKYGDPVDVKVAKEGEVPDWFKPAVVADEKEVVVPKTDAGLVEEKDDQKNR